MSRTNQHLRINLSFDGQCETAFKLYERCFGGNIAIMLRWGESPMAQDAPPNWSGKILYARLRIGDFDLVGGDALPGTYESPRGMSVMINLNDPAEAERLFQVLSENGSIRMGLEETFWAHRYGVLTDRFGIPWEINCEKSA
jgi:PhnB protein